MSDESCDWLESPSWCIWQMRCRMKEERTEIQERGEILHLIIAVLCEVDAQVPDKGEYISIILGSLNVPRIMK